MEIVTNLQMLHIPSTEVTSIEEADSIIKKLEDAFMELKENGKNGYGIAAVQIGIYKRVSIVRMPDGLMVNLINPKIIVKEIPITFNESCYSLPGLVIKTDRYQYIQIENGFDKTVMAFSELRAIVVQHEIAHMNGKTILDFKHRKK